MNFYRLATLFQQIESISGRLDMMATLAKYFDECTPTDAAISSYLLLGRVAPMFIPAEFNYSEKGIEKVLSNMCKLKGVKVDLLQLRQQLGDIGLVAEQVIQRLLSEGDDKSNSNKNDSTQNRDLESVYKLLWKIVNTTGSNSMDEKGALLYELLSSSTPVEAKYLSRIIASKMRLGASTNTIIEAISYHRKADKSEVESIKIYYGVLADIGVISYRLVGGLRSAIDLQNIESIGMKVGIPVKSRLVERVGDFAEVFERIGPKFIAQPKFDGLRCQAHIGVDYQSIAKSMEDALWAKYYVPESSANTDENTMDMFATSTNAWTPGFGSTEFVSPDIESTDTDENKLANAEKNIELFSRNLESTTDMFPEITAALKSLDCTSCVLDGEIEGVGANGAFLNFQQTITRKRKHGVGGAVENVPVKYFVFDIIELDGRDLTELDTIERIAILQKLLAKGASELIQLAETREISTQEALKEFFDECVKEGLEGLVVKQFKGSYKPGIRNFEWLKLKKSMDKNLVDSVDLVVMGYYYGSGKQVDLGVGALLGGVYNEETEQYESITKIGTGFTEDLWKRIFTRLQPLVVPQKPVEYTVSPNMSADVWVSPEVVCAVEADEVTQSKMHEAGRTQLGYGLALRFPRMIEFDRDKGVDDLTTVGELINNLKVR